MEASLAGEFAKKRPAALNKQRFSTSCIPISPAILRAQAIRQPLQALLHGLPFTFSNRIA